jgi:hypothetical protein
VGQGGEVEPVVVVDVGVVRGVDDVGEVAPFLEEVVGDLAEDGLAVAVEEVPGVGEVVEGEVAQGEGLGGAGVVAPGVDGVRRQHHAVQDDPVDERVQSGESEEQEGEEEGGADAPADRALLKGHSID